MIRRRSRWVRLAGLALLGCSVAAGAADGAAFEMHSSALAAGADAPRRFSCQGAGLSPPLAWSGVSARAKSLALIVDDPDAPSGDWVHWIVYNIAPDTRSLPENVRVDALPGDARFGANSWGDAGYGGMCPPSGRHRYVFKLYALDTTLADKAYDKPALLAAMRGHIIARTRLVATYKQ